MDTSKKWMGFAAIGACVAALFGRLRHRDDRDGTPPKQADPADTVN